MMPPVLIARLTLLLALIPAACQQTPEEERAYASLRPSIEGVASERLGPVSRFMGMWEGTLEGVAGNYRLIKRVAWLVPNSWLLEQTMALDEQTGKEIDRSAVIYTVNPVTRSLEARLLLAGGAEFQADVPFQGHEFDQGTEDQGAHDVDDDGAVGKTVTEQAADQVCGRISADRAQGAAGGDHQKQFHLAGSALSLRQ